MGDKKFNKLEKVLVYHTIPLQIRPTAHQTLRGKSGRSSLDSEQWDLIHLNYVACLNGQHVCVYECVVSTQITVCRDLLMGSLLWILWMSHWSHNQHCSGKVNLFIILQHGMCDAAMPFMLVTKIRLYKCMNT